MSYGYNQQTAANIALNSISPPGGPLVNNPPPFTYQSAASTPNYNYNVQNMRAQNFMSTYTNVNTTPLLPTQNVGSYNNAPKNPSSTIMSPYTVNTPYTGNSTMNMLSSNFSNTTVPNNTVVNSMQNTLGNNPMGRNNLVSSNIPPISSNNSTTMNSGYSNYMNPTTSNHNSALGNTNYKTSLNTGTNNNTVGVNSTGYNNLNLNTTNNSNFHSNTPNTYLNNGKVSTANSLPINNRTSLGNMNTLNPTSVISVGLPNNNLNTLKSNIPNYMINNTANNLNSMNMNSNLNNNNLNTMNPNNYSSNVNTNNNKRISMSYSSSPNSIPTFQPITSTGYANSSVNTQPLNNMNSGISNNLNTSQNIRNNLNTLLNNNSNHLNTLNSNIPNYMINNPANNLNSMNINSSLNNNNNLNTMNPNNYSSNINSNDNKRASININYTHGSSSSLPPFQTNTSPALLPTSGYNNPSITSQSINSNMSNLNVGLSNNINTSPMNKLSPGLNNNVNFLNPGVNANGYNNSGYNNNQLNSRLTSNTNQPTGLTTVNTGMISQLNGINQMNGLNNVQNSGSNPSPSAMNALNTSLMNMNLNSYNNNPSYSNNLTQVNPVISEEEKKRKQLEEEERIRKEVQERVQREQERLYQESQEKIRKEEERIRKELTEVLKKEEEEKLRLLQLQNLAREEEARRIREETERKQKEEFDRKWREREMKWKEEEESRKRKEEEELIKRQEEERKLREELENIERKKRELERIEIERLERERIEHEKKQKVEESSWRLPISDLTFIELVGKGAFGSVFKGKLHGKDVAIKKLLSQALTDDVIKEFSRETSIFSQLRHPNILLFIGACLEPGNFAIVTEYMSNGSLQDLLFTKQINISFKQRLKILKDIVLGMNWLHSMKPPFLHRDLKAGNILLDENWRAKVSDFGFSCVKSLDADGEKIEGPVGSPFYMAPEVLLCQPFDTKADVYSFSIIVWETLANDEPYKGEFDNFDELVEGITVDNMRPPIPDWFPPGVSQLIQMCWDKDPQKRLSFNDIITQGWFDHFLVDFFIQDPVASHFWKSSFLEKDLVRWDEFQTALIHYFQISSNEQLAQVQPKLAIIKHLISKTSPETGIDEVTIENFATIPDWFGPFESPNQLIDKPYELFSNFWYHGQIDQITAENVLKGANPKVWLVRQSSIIVENDRLREFFISVVDDSRNVQHYPVYQTRDGVLYFNNQPYENWPALIHTNQNALSLNIGTPCFDSPMCKFY